MRELLVILIALLSVSQAYPHSQYHGQCSMCIFNGLEYCNEKCQDLGDGCEGELAKTYITQCNTTASTNPNCFQNFTITEENIGEYTLVEVELKDHEWCYIMVQDQIEKTYLKDSIALWEVNANNSVFLMFIEAEAGEVTDELLLTMNVSDTNQFLTSMPSGINKMVFNYTHVIFTMNLRSNDTSGTFSISYTNSLIGTYLALVSIITLQILNYIL